MKKKIQDIQNHFKSCLFSGKFEVVKIETHIIKLSIEGHEFMFWIGNPEFPRTTKNYAHHLSFMNLEFTDAESCKFWEVLEPIVKNYYKNELITQKEMELEKLKKGL